MKLTHNKTELTYEIMLGGQTYIISQEGTEIEDAIAEQILMHYGDYITVFEKNTDENLDKEI